MPHVFISVFSRNEPQRQKNHLRLFGLAHWRLLGVHFPPRVGILFLLS